MKLLSNIFIFAVISGLLLSAGLIAFGKEEIVIESEESKNAELKSVFNKIRWIQQQDRDIWMMNQSHFGPHPNEDKWERLAIVVDKTKSPYVASFYQIKSGPLEWSDDLIKQRVHYRARCFICHNNGPRAIRPLPESSEAPLSLADRAKMVWWNLRIKTYGRIVYNKVHDEEAGALQTPFRYDSSRDNDVLKVKTCQMCHSEEGFFARGFLLRQQNGTITHMVSSGHMPPPGFFLSDQEKKQLRDFLRGF